MDNYDNNIQHRIYIYRDISMVKMKEASDKVITQVEKGTYETLLLQLPISDSFPIPIFIIWITST